MDKLFYLFCVYVVNFGYLSAGCGENGLLMKDPSTPCKYLQCVHGRTISRECPSGLGVQLAFTTGNRNPCVVTYDQCKEKEEPTNILHMRVHTKQHVQPKQANKPVVSRLQEQAFKNTNKPHVGSPQNDIYMNKPENQPQQQQMIRSNKIPPQSQNRKHLKQLFTPDSYSHQPNFVMYPSHDDSQTINFQPPPNINEYFPQQQNFDFAKNPNNNFDSEFQTFLTQVSNTNNNNGYPDSQSNFGNGNNGFSMPTFDENQFAQTAYQHNQASNFNYPPQQAAVVHPIQESKTQHFGPEMVHYSSNDNNAHYNQAPQQYNIVHQQPQTNQQPQLYNTQHNMDQTSYQQHPSPVHYQEISVSSHVPQQQPHQQQQPAQVHYDVRKFEQPILGHNAVQVQQQTNTAYQAQSSHNVQDMLLSGYPKADISLSIPINGLHRLQQAQQHAQQQAQQQAHQQAQQQQQTYNTNLYQQLIPKPTAPASIYQPQIQVPVQTGYGTGHNVKAVTRAQQQQALAKLIPFILKVPQHNSVSHLAQNVPLGAGQRKLLLAKILQRLIKAIKSGKVTRLNRKANLSRSKLQQLGQILKKKKTTLRQQPKRRRRVQKGGRRRRKQRRGRGRGGRRRYRQGIMGKMAEGQGFQINAASNGGTQSTAQSQRLAQSQDQEVDYSNDVDYTSDGSDYNYADEQTSTDETTFDYDANNDVDYAAEADNTDGGSVREDQYSDSGTNAPESENSKFRHMRDGIRIPISPKEGTLLNPAISGQQQPQFQSNAFGNQHQNNFLQQQSLTGEIGSSRQSTNQNVRTGAQLSDNNQQIQYQQSIGSSQVNNIRNNNRLNAANIPNDNNQFAYNLAATRLKQNLVNNQYGNGREEAVNKLLQGQQQQPKYSFTAQQNPDTQFSQLDFSVDDGRQQTRITASEQAGNTNVKTTTFTQQSNSNKQNANSRSQTSSISVDQNIDVNSASGDIDPSLFDDMPLEYLQLLQEFAMEYIENTYGDDQNRGNEILKSESVENGMQYQSTPDQLNQGDTDLYETSQKLNPPKTNLNQFQSNNFNQPNMRKDNPTETKEYPQRSKFPPNTQKSVVTIEDTSTLPPIAPNNDANVNPRDIMDSELQVRGNNVENTNLPPGLSNYNSNNFLSKNSLSTKQRQQSAPIQNTNDNTKATEKMGIQAENEVNFLEFNEEQLNDVSNTFVVDDNDADDSEDSEIEKQILKEDIAFQEALTYYSKILHSLSDFVTTDASSDVPDTQGTSNIQKGLNKPNPPNYSQNKPIFSEQLQNYSYRDITTEIDQNEYESNDVADVEN